MEPSRRDGGTRRTTRVDGSIGASRARWTRSGTRWHWWSHRFTWTTSCGQASSTEGSQQAFCFFESAFAICFSAFPQWSHTFTWVNLCQREAASHKAPSEQGRFVFQISGLAFPVPFSSISIFLLQSVVRASASAGLVFRQAVVHSIFFVTVSGTGFPSAGLALPMGQCQFQSFCPSQWFGFPINRASFSNRPVSVSFF